MTRNKKLRIVALAILLLTIVGAAAAGAAPDLAVTEVTADRVVANPDERIAVSVIVTNSGGLSAGASRLKYYFSTDATYDESDTYLNYDNVDPLAGGASAPETANVRIPDGTPDGAYYVLVIADFDGDVAEIDEWNNTYALPVAVGDLTPTDGPDFVLEDVALGATHADPDEVITSSATVKNTGNEAAAESRLKYYLSTDTVYDDGDTYLNYDAVSPLAPGEQSAETANLRVPAGTPDGQYYVLFVADETDVAVELAEDDNVVALTLLVGDAAADLVPENVSIPTPTVLAGETLGVGLSVRNAGAADAADARLVYFLSEDTQLDAADKQLSFDKIDALAAGASGPEGADLRVSSATPSGSYFVLFVVDADEVIDESDERNNLVAVAVTVTGDDPDAIAADLVLVGATLDAPVVPAGEQVSASVTVRNDGVVDAPDSRLKYYLSTDSDYDDGDDYLNYDNTGALTVGASSAETANLRIPAGTADGDYYILFVADETREVTERYESNNVVALTVTVGEPSTDPLDDPDAEAADLMVVSASVDTMAIRAGERASLHCTVENVGDFTADAASRVKYYLSADTTYDEGDDYVGYDNVPALAPGESSDESATPRIPELTAHGRWYLLVVADEADDVSETFESNNVASIAIDVVVDQPSLDAPDLVASSPVLSKGTVGAGFKLDVDVTVENQGTQPAPESRLKLYLSDDTRHDDGDTYLAYRRVADLGVQDALAVHADMRIPTSVADGAVFLLVVVDTERAMTERYESNNVLAVALTIGADEGPNPAYPYACPNTVFTDATLVGKHTVATLNTLRLGHNNGKDMTALACIVSHFDLVGLVEIYDPAGVTELELEVEAVTGETWSSHVSPTAVGNENGMEYYAFIWRDAEVTMTRAVGYFDDADDVLKREPYGADFRMGAFDFTLVVFHLQYGQTLATRRFEAQQMRAVYDWFQANNGTEDDVLFGGDLNLPGDDAAFTLTGHDGIAYITDPEQPTTIGYDGPASSFDNIFYSRNHTTELIGSGAHDYTMGNWDTVVEDVTDHFPVWAAFDTTVDDD
jgi:subtilase family serine protease